MDIHKPKPWHGVREFLKEYAIIVIGVLTALAAEQGVQAFDWQRRVADAEVAMRSELADNTRFAFERLARSSCEQAEIAAMRAALAKNRDEGASVPLQPLFVSGNRLWSMDAWEDARALQLTGHIPVERMRIYSRAYTHTANYRVQQARMREDRSDVNTLAYNAGRITPAERDRLFGALQRLDDGGRELDGQAIRVLEAAKRLGVEVSAADKKMILESNAKSWTPAGCVTDPSSRIANPRSKYDWFMGPDAPRRAG